MRCCADEEGMSPVAAAREFVAAMVEPRPDPYAGADLETSRRVTAALLGLSTLLALCFLPLEPPDEELGDAGWAIAAALVAGGAAATVMLVRRRPGFRGLLMVAYAGVAGVCALDWLAGGASAYSHLFILWLGAGAVHPPRRAFTYLAVMIAALWLPFAYGHPNSGDAVELAAQSLLLLAIGSVLISYLFHVRRQRLGLQAGAEVARRLARVDSLTGLPNRRALDETLTVEVARSARAGNPLAVGLVDLDGLRRVNERFGHLEGDRCLQEAARAMERSLRANDLCFRWGGDEFVVVLAGTDRAGADGVLQRMAEGVGRVCAEGDDRGLTVSYGTAELAEGGSAEDLLAAADLALMEQKTQKRR
jgi:diguanylate cyclase (GGDEF)-like protein